MIIQKKHKRAQVCPAPLKGFINMPKIERIGCLLDFSLTDPYTLFRFLIENKALKRC